MHLFLDRYPITFLQPSRIQHSKRSDNKEYIFLCLCSITVWARRLLNPSAATERQRHDPTWWHHQIREWTHQDVAGGTSPHPKENLHQMDEFIFNKGKVDWLTAIRGYNWELKCSIKNVVRWWWFHGKMVFCSSIKVLCRSRVFHLFLISFHEIL